MHPHLFEVTVTHLSCSMPGRIGGRGGLAVKPVYGVGRTTDWSLLVLEHEESNAADGRPGLVCCTKKMDSGMVPLVVHAICAVQSMPRKAVGNLQYRQVRAE